MIHTDGKRDYPAHGHERYMTMKKILRCWLSEITLCWHRSYSQICSFCFPSEKMICHNRSNCTKSHANMDKSMWPHFWRKWETEIETRKRRAICREKCMARRKYMEIYIIRFIRKTQRNKTPSSRPTTPMLGQRYTQYKGRRAPNFASCNSEWARSTGSCQTDYAGEWECLV